MTLSTSGEERAHLLMEHKKTKAETASGLRTAHIESSASSHGRTDKSGEVVERNRDKGERPGKRRQIGIDIQRRRKPFTVGEDSDARDKESKKINEESMEKQCHTYPALTTAEDDTDRDRQEISINFVCHFIRTR